MERSVGQTQHAGMYIEAVDGTLDLRRRQSRTRGSRLVRRAHWLEAQDREITLAYFDRGMNAAEIGTLLSMDPRCVRRRIKHIVARLEDPRCAYVIAHRGGWTTRRRSIAEGLFVRGESMREVSDRLGVSLHSVRRQRDAIEAMTQAQEDTQRPSRAWQRSERSL